MNSISDALDLRRKQFYNIKVRERILILVCALLLIGFVLDFLILEPKMRVKTALKTDISSLQTEAAKLEKLKAEVLTAVGAGNVNESRILIENKKLLVEELAQKILQGTSRLVGPEKMQPLLSDALARSKGVTLIEFKNMPPVNLLGDKVKELESVPVVIYKHGLEISLEGGYDDLLDYLTKLEQSQWQFVWESVELSRQTYPKIRMRLRVFTLSDKMEWLGV